MITRLIGSPLAQSRKSVFLLGPRQVGKSTLIQGLNPDLVIQLPNEKAILFAQIANLRSDEEDFKKNAERASVHVSIVF